MYSRIDVEGIFPTSCCDRDHDEVIKNYFLKIENLDRDLESPP